MATKTVLMGLVLVAVASADKYTTKYDNVDVDEILNNKRLLDSYFKCVMGEGKCTPDGEELKKDIPEALETNCEKCSEKQKAGVEKVLKFLFEKREDLFKKLEAKFDPEGTYRKKYQKFAEEKGIKL